MGRTACTEPQCLYKGALYLYLTVELYLYSSYGQYDLYRASVPVQECTLLSLHGTTNETKWLLFYVSRNGCKYSKSTVVHSSPQSMLAVTPLEA
jgi:hypothetical protein